MIMVFDTETTGFPVKNPASLDQQPYVTQLAISLYDDNRRPVYEISTMVKIPSHVVVPPKVTELTGITTEMCLTYGVSMHTALGLFRFAMERSHTSIAHNYKFDQKMLEITALRCNQPVEFINPFCTMEACRDVIQLPPTPKMLAAGFTKPKNPNLSECWDYFFGEKLEGAHDALTDTRGAARVFFELADQGLLAAQK